MKIIHFDELPSTNQYLLELIGSETCEEGLCIQADYQTNGRGQQGNFWESEAGKNLTFSFVLHPDFLFAAEQFILSQLVSVAIKQTLDKYVDDVSVKWPNDIYWKENKIAGILIENSLMGDRILYSVIGVGLNVNQTNFRSNAPNPISLKSIIGNSVDMHALLDEILSAVVRLYVDVAEGNDDLIRRYYSESLYRKDGFYPFSDNNGIFQARIERVLADGRLSLMTDKDEKRLYYFKEVSFVF